LRLLVGILLILIGSILSGLTIDNISFVGNIIMKLLGVGIIAAGILFARKRKGYQPVITQIDPENIK
jgi:hypothetical protein